MKTKNKSFHQPVLVKEVLSFLPPEANLIADATSGTGGHSAAMAAKLQRTNAKFQIVCIDFDCASLEVAKKRLEKYDQKIKFFCDNFSNLKNILKNQQADFILADLGFSSWQLESGRGVSFSKNEPLDMRLNKRLKTTATDLINHLDEKSLADLIYQYSDERFSRQISRAIVKRRPLCSTRELAEIISQAVGKRYHSKISPATRTFQALRIAVNRELENLEKFLPAAAGCLAKNGRLAIIGFHSQEERLIRNYFKKLKKSGKFQILTRQPIKPAPKEIQTNPRSRSARLRVIKKIV